MVGRGHSSDRETVAFVAVRHRDSVIAYSIKMSDVDALLDRPVGLHLCEKLVICVDARRDLHAGLVVAWNLPYVGSYFVNRYVAAGPSAVALCCLAHLTSSWGRGCSL